MKKLIRQGQWNVTFAGHNGVAEVLELEGFGIVGGVIDREGSSIILERAIAYSAVVAALRRLLECPALNMDELEPEDIAAYREAQDLLEDVPKDDEDHDHVWGPLERSRLAGTVHRKCTVPGCDAINALDDEQERSLEEERSGIELD